MKHGVKKRKFGRTKKTRGALIASLIKALVIEEKIETTEAKARELRPAVEKMITKAKVDTLSNRRILASRLHNNNRVVSKLFDLGKRYNERPGGYTRIIKLAPRSSDAAKRAVIEFV
jgi:large subunit ribosomal protein L17